MNDSWRDYFCAVLTEKTIAFHTLGCTHIMDINYYNTGFAWPETGAGRVVFEAKDVRVYSYEDAVAR